MKAKTYLVTLVLLALVGCTVGPKYVRPKVQVEASFPEMSKTTNGNPSHATAGAPVSEWWKSFHDPELDRLITEALRANYNLRIASMRIREARYQRSIVAADLFPNIDADGGYMLSRGSKNVALDLGSSSSSSSSGGGNTSKSTARKADAQQSQTQTGPSPYNSQLTPFGEGGLPGVTSSLYQIGFDANWEIDVFGGNRKRLEAATADLSGAVEGFRDMTVTLLAEVARDYLELRGTQQRLDVARKNLASQNETVDLTRSLVKSGLRSQLDVTRAQAQAAATSATIPPLATQAQQLIHALSILLSKEPTALRQELEVAKGLPPVPPEVPVGLPSELLKRRPDIRRAEREIASATAHIGSAKADLFPQFGLTGSIGLDSSSAGNLLDAGSRYFLISPTVAWRVFDAGRIVSNIALQRANEQESILQYRAAILTALQEVEDSLVAYGSEQTRRAALLEAVKQNQESVQLSRQQYEHGLTTFLDVLDAERSLFLAQDNLAQSDQSITTDLVALYKALGGGWEK